MIENDIRVFEPRLNRYWIRVKWTNLYTTRNLQIGELKPLLDEEEYDEDKPQTDKYFFLSVLREMFTVFRRSGDDKLEYYKGKCEGCRIKTKIKLYMSLKELLWKNQFGFIPIDQK